MDTVALLAGGRATRLYPVTQGIPKAMVEVAGRPFIDFQLKLFSQQGIHRVVLCVGHLAEQIEDYVGDGKAFGLSVVYSHDGEQLRGTGGALVKALPLLDKDFFVMYGDSYFNIDFQQVASYYRFHDYPGLMTVLRNQNRWDRSNVSYRDGKIIRYDKREKTPDMEYIDYGLGILNQDVFREFKDKVRLDLVDVYQTLVHRGELLGYEVYERFYEIGSPQGLEELNRYLTNRMVD